MPLALSAQSIQGVVLSGEDLSPVPSARVLLVDLGGDDSLAGLTDDRGRFLFENPRGEGYRIEVSALGYLTHVDSIFTGPPADPLVLEIRLGVDAIPLRPLTVVGSRRPLWQSTEPRYLWEFFERQEFYGRLGEGRFFDRAALTATLGEDRSVSELHNLWPAAAFGLRAKGREPEPGALQRPVPGLEPDSLEKRYCEGSDLFLDGLRYDGSLSDLVYSVGDLSGMELYDGRTPIPAEFQTRRKPPCRVMSIWTRRPAVSAEKTGFGRGAVWFVLLVGFAAVMIGR